MDNKMQLYNNEVDKIQNYLQQNHPNNILIHSKNKVPLYKHANGWSWEQFNEARKTIKRPVDISILLNDLVVFDFDSIELAEIFENKFPVLNEVPCEKTKKGAHYFFKRNDDFKISAETA